MPYHLDREDVYESALRTLATFSKKGNVKDIKYIYSEEELVEKITQFFAELRKAEGYIDGTPDIHAREELDDERIEDIEYFMPGLRFLFRQFLTQR